MRIVQVITRLILGGAQQTVIQLCRRFIEQGHEVTLVYGPIYGPEGSLWVQAEASGAQLVELESMRREISPLDDRRCTRQLREMFREMEPDVVHTHSSKAGILGRAAAWAEGVQAVVHTIHGLSWHDRQSALKNRAYLAAERYAARRCHRLIAVTPQMKDDFVRRRVAPADRITVIPSGLDLDRYDLPIATRERVRRELGIPDDAPVVGIVARLDPLKGHDDLLDALPRLRERFPPLRLMFVGDGWDGDRLKQRIESEGLSDAVMNMGLVPEGAVPALLSAMDVKVLPSYQEGQSRTLPEALLCGCGVVAYDAGGIGSIVVDGETGRLVPVGDKARLADAIAWMIDHPDERRRLTAAGAELIRTRYSEEVMLDAHEALYAELVAADGRG